MKKLFLDTNIVLDLLARRDPFYNEAALLFSMADKKEVQLSVSALTFATVNYVLSRQKSAKETKMILRKLKLLVHVTSLDEKVLDLSLNDADFSDFEDALQHYSALENGIDILITRNLKDYQKSLLPVMTAEQFLKSIQNNQNRNLQA